MSRRDIIRGDMCEPTMDMDQAWLADHAVLMRDELKALWARVKLLDLVVETAELHLEQTEKVGINSPDCYHEQRLRRAIEALSAHDSEQG